MIYEKENKKKKTHRKLLKGPEFPCSCILNYIIHIRMQGGLQNLTFTAVLVNIAFENLLKSPSRHRRQYNIIYI